MSDETPQQTENEAVDAQETSTEEALGDPGKKAIDAMKAERNAARRERDALQKRIAEIEQSQMTDIEKAQRRAEEAEKRAADLEAANERKSVALEFGLGTDDAELLDSLTDPDAMRRLATRLAHQAREDAGPRRPRPDPNQGRGSDGVLSAEDAFVAFAK